MINVIVVPENDEFKYDVTHNLEVYINKDIGQPKLQERNVKYLAPFWLNKAEYGVDRLYHIVSVVDNVIYLGNSFILNEIWNKAGQTRKFEYHSLDSFNFVEIKDGLLTHYDFNSK
jgi:hypothetical protein